MSTSLRHQLRRAVRRSHISDHRLTALIHMHMHRQVGIYAGRVLKGAKPSDLPVQQSARVDVAINLRTAKALGLTIPAGVLAMADEVIE